MVSAEQRQEEFQVLNESLLKSFDMLFEASRALITLIEQRMQRSMVESVRPVDIVNKIQQTFSTFEVKKRRPLASEENP